jgi:biotin carboxyl carrier protein
MPQVSQSSAGTQVPTPADLIDRLSRFDGPPELFLVNLLAVQCYLAAAEAGAILRAAAANRQPEVLAVYPPLAEGAALPVWLAQAVESAPEVAAGGVTATRPIFGPDDLYGQEARRQLILVPLRGAQGVRGMTAYAIGARSPAAMEATRERLEITVSLLSLYEMRLTLQQRHLDFQRLRTAMEVLSAVNEHNRFAGAGMALCNEVAARFRAERVGLGFLKGRYVHLRALSHTEKFSRKMKIVQDIEAAMEECLDQDVEVLYPASPEVTYANRAAGELAKRHGPSAAVSLPLRRGGEVVAVLTLERPADQPLALEEVETLRLTGELCTARLANLHEQDRWFGARAAAATRKGLAAALGPKHTWAKVGAILGLAAVLFLALAKGEYKVDAPFVIEAVQRRVVPAPFEGFLKEAAVLPGDPVRAGQVLGRLKTTELELELARSQADLARYENDRQAAMEESKRAEQKVAQEQIRKTEAEIGLLTHKIRQATIVSPIDGVVLTGDLERQIGSPVKTGDVLFEVAPLDSLRAELKVGEDQIADVLRAMAKRDRVGGELATAAEPGRRIRFVIERVIPVAEVVEQKNVFQARATLEGVDLAADFARMRPGLEGVAKVEIERRHYAWIWTRRLVNWVRMKLWW